MPILTDETYVPGSSTPLYDAMGRTLTKLEKELKGDENHSVVVTVITDGYENDSHEYGLAAIKALVEHLKEEGWSFAYMGTDHDVHGVSVSLSITNVVKFEKTEEARKQAVEERNTALLRRAEYVSEEGWEALSLDDADKAVGLALGDKLLGRDCRTYLLVGDGEANEGQVWEAAMFTAAKELTNLVWLIDWNKKQLDGPLDDILKPFDFEEKFRAFGFDACTIDGNDVAQVKEALSKKAGDRPIAIILDTVKGKGVTEVENTAGNHSMAVGPEVFDSWIAELQSKLDALGA